MDNSSPEQWTDRIDSPPPSLSGKGWEFLRHEFTGDLLRSMLNRMDPPLIVYCKSATNHGGHIYEYFVPRSLSTDPTTGIVKISGQLGTDKPWFHLVFDPANPTHDDEKHITTIARIRW